jgi:beta-lactamase superfamily II metal-dependent hydrolase
MRLQMFQSGKGDCLLLSNAANSARILVDGGMPVDYRAHVAPALGRLRTARRKLDLVYVSHIDQDHIGGILGLLNDEVSWRVHEFQTERATPRNPHHPVPEVARPPQIEVIWHNAFHEVVDDNDGAIERLLAAAVPVLSGSDLQALRKVAERQSDLVESIREAILVSRRIGPKQLGIPLNPQANGKLMMRRDGQPPVVVGGMSIRILGPTSTELSRLRKDWNTWLEKNRKALDGIAEQARQDEERLGTSEFQRLLRRFSLQAERFGDPSSVTPPNLASLTLLVEEQSQSVLLTGDARGDQIVEGLQAVGGPTANGRFAVDVMKVPHHGSENNVDRAFCDAVVATDYVFCGNGEHENPDLRVVKLMAERRLAVPGSFKFWFNSSEAVSRPGEPAAHMLAVEDLVRDLARSSRGRMKFKFLTKGSSLVVR